MPAAPIPGNEAARLRALHELSLLDTPPDGHLDGLVELVTRRLRVASAAISLVDRGRQWFKARVNVPTAETPRALAFCAYTILGTEPLVVADATADARFCDNPLVTHAPCIRCYAGFPLATAGGHAVGTLCVVDFAPRVFSPQDLATLAAVSRAVVGRITLRRAVAGDILIAESL
jgi:GAF domain-containing protein